MENNEDFKDGGDGKKNIKTSRLFFKTSIDSEFLSLFANWFNNVLFVKYIYQQMHVRSNLSIFIFLYDFLDKGAECILFRYNY